LKRHQYDKESISRIKEAYRILYRSDLAFKEAVIKLKQEYADFEEIQELINFCDASKRGIIR
jgi:UDP-N-acetylglucosamine acyltransferase